MGMAGKKIISRLRRLDMCLSEGRNLPFVEVRKFELNEPIQSTSHPACFGLAGDLIG
jgi:hypothetical protein